MSDAFPSSKASVSSEKQILVNKAQFINPMMTIDDSNYPKELLFKPELINCQSIEELINDLKYMPLS